MATEPTGKTFQFDLVSPEKILFSEQVSMVTIPGEAGEFGVLPDHAPLLSSLLPGVVTVTRADGSLRKVYVSGGFADVSDNQCAVLAEGAVFVEDMDLPALREKLSGLQQALAQSADPMEKMHLTREAVLLSDMIRLAA